MDDNKNLSRIYPVVICIVNIIICSIIFYIDFKLPLGAGTAASVPYIAVIMLSLWLPAPIHTLYFSLLCSALTIIGYFVSPLSDHTEIWESILNRGVILFAIWVTAILAIYRKSSALRLKHSEFKNNLILKTALDPIITINESLIIETASDSVEKNFIWKPKELIGKNFLILFHDSEKKELNDDMQDDSINHIKREIKAIDKNHHEILCELTVSKIYSSKLKHLFMMTTLRNIEIQKKAEKKLIWLSTHDELTKIYNRRHFNKKIDYEWQRLIRERNPIGLIMIDIDYFKKYNDTLGHQAGDTCLKEVANILPKHLNRASDFAARYGGEEFVILLPNVDGNGLLNMLQLIQKEIDNLKIPHPVSKISDYVTISMGATSMLPNKACGAEILINRADYALYQAKKAGRNQFIIFKD